MPELPEVETVVRGLSTHLPGQTIKTVEVITPRSFLWATALPDPESIIGLRVLSLSRRGKGIIIHLSKGYCLLIHLKMTGQLIYIPASTRHSGLDPESRKEDRKILKQVQDDDTGRLNFGHPDANFISTMPSRHTRVWFQLSNGRLYFNDQRLFGWVKLTREELLEKDPFISKLGPEPFDPAFTPELLFTITQRRPKATIKSIIMDQSVVTGVGNIYADEALFATGIRPTRPGASITKTEAATLTQAIKDILKKGIKYSGTSMSHYRTGEGAQGKMQNYLNMYGRKDQPCPTCGNPIHKIRVAGRGTHYCPTCQN